MQPFLQHRGHEYYLLPLERPAVFDLPFARQPYPCLLWDTGGAWHDTEREALVLSLLSTDCRYAVCGGATCEEWHDALDLAFIRTVPQDQVDARFMMTTWHTNEPALEVAWFFAWNTDFEEHEFHRYLVIQLGVAPPDLDLAAAVTRAVTDPEGAIAELPDDAG